MKKQGRITEAVKTALRQTTTAVVHSVDGDQVNLQFGDMPALIRNVEVIGAASLLQSGEAVDILWRDGRPVVLAYRTLEQGTAETVVLSENAAAEQPVVEVFATRAGNQSIATGTWAAVNWNNILVDTHNMAGISQVTCKVAGLYIVETCIEFAANASGARGIQMYLNDVDFTSDLQAAPSGVNWRTTQTRTVRLAVDDALQIRAYQSSGNALAVQANNHSPILSIRRLGA
jgi:hypothetical protein